MYTSINLHDRVKSDLKLAIDQSGGMLYCKTKLISERLQFHDFVTCTVISSGMSCNCFSSCICFQTALHWAAKHGQAEVVKLLCGQPGAKDIVNIQSVSCIFQSHYAVPCDTYCSA